MSDATTWFETAKNHLKIAQKNLVLGEFLTAFREAITCAELTLKSVLVKKEIFTKKDKHHKIIPLYNKIKSEKCLPSNIEHNLDKIFGTPQGGGLGYINVSSPNGSHIDTTAGFHTNLRYPVSNSTPDKFITEADAREKLKQAEQLIKIISPHFKIL